MNSFSVLADPVVQRAVDVVSDAAKMRGGAKNMVGGAPTPAEVAAAAQADALVKCEWVPLGRYRLLYGVIPQNYGRGSSIPDGVMYMGSSSTWSSLLLSDGRVKYFYLSKKNLDGNDNFSSGMWPSIPMKPNSSNSVYYFRFKNASNNAILRMDEIIDGAKNFYINNVLQMNYVQSGPNGQNPVVPPTVGTSFNFGDEFEISFAFCNPNVLFPEAKAQAIAIKEAEVAQADELVKCQWAPLGDYKLLYGVIPQNYGRGSSIPDGVMYMGSSSTWSSLLLSDGRVKYFYLSKKNINGKDNFSSGMWPSIPMKPNSSNSVYYFKFKNASNNVILRMDEIIDGAKNFYINNVLQMNYVQSGPNGQNPVVPPTVGTSFNFGDQFEVSFAFCNPDVLFPEAQAIVDAKKAAELQVLKESAAVVIKASAAKAASAAEVVRASAAEMVKVSAAKAASAAEVVRASAAEMVKASAAKAASAAEAVRASAAEVVQASAARQKASAAQASAAKAALAASITSSLSSKVTSSAAQETLSTTLDALSSPAVQTAMDKIAALATPTGGSRKRRNRSQRVKRSKRATSRKHSRSH